MLALTDNDLPSLDWLRLQARKEKYIIDQTLLSRIGYHRVDTDARSWENMHNWCKKNVNNDDYTWTGSIFWFRNQKHALLFAVAWGK